MIRAALLLAAALLVARSQQPTPTETPQSQLLTCGSSKHASPANSKRLQFVPEKLDAAGWNLRPQISFSISDDGSVDDVRIVKGTGSLKVDAGLLNSIQAWRFAPQPSCRIASAEVILIDLK
jgi:TonB family protein